MRTFGDIDIGLEDGSVDAALLYDIFWYFPLEDYRLSELLDEVYRVSKSDALLSVLPKHIDSERLQKAHPEMGKAYNNIPSIHTTSLHHDVSEGFKMSSLLRYKYKGSRNRQCGIPRL